MDANKIMPIVVLALVIYVWGVLNRGWTSPVDIAVDIACRRGGHRWCGHDLPSSDDVDDDEDPDEPPMSTPRVQPAPTRTETLQRPAGPEPLDELLRHQIEHDEASQDLQPGETRIAWVRRQMDAGILTPKEIDEIGAAKYGLNPRTIRRWRKSVGDQRED